MRERLLVGLPSLNEADTIAAVTRDIDDALATLPFEASPVLVNADSSSTDGTAEAFLAVPTRCPKLSLTTPSMAGKGANWHALLRMMTDDGFAAGIMVDTDLAGVPASWIHALSAAVADTDFVFPLRPPTWNGGDLTYQLAYPALAGTFGLDLREPLCGDIAISLRGAGLVLDQEWEPSEYRFGVDTLVASVALTSTWRMVPLRERRRNKLRSFSTHGGDYRMGAKFAEVATAVQHRCWARLAAPMPTRFTQRPEHTPDADGQPVPMQDPDITRLAESTSRRLTLDLQAGTVHTLPDRLAGQLADHIDSGMTERGLPWPLWREILLAWIKDHDRGTIPMDLLETLFLHRVAGHHHEIKGRVDWYGTVGSQALDLFDHRASLWDASVTGRGLDSDGGQPP